MTFSDNFNQFKNVIFIGFLTVIFHTFQPLWYFQGKNEIKKFAIYMIFVKLVFISFLLVFDIFSTNSFNSILLWSISNLFGSIIAFIEMKKTGFKFTKVSFSYLFEILRESFEYFLSRAAVSLYTVGTTFIIGFFNLTDAAIFSIAEQLYRGAKSMLGTLAQGIYPVILPTKNFSLFKKVLIQGFFFTCIVSISLTFFGEFLISNFFNSEFQDSKNLITYFSLILIFHFFGMMFGYPLTSLHNNNKISNYSVIYGVLIFSITLYSINLTNQVNSLTMILCIFITELFVLIYRAYKIMRN